MPISASFSLGVEPAIHHPGVVGAPTAFQMVNRAP
jgi:hypothetical protein